ncbi:MAG: prolyl oligopeptidase family serine peptidase [Myxococcota bacterium]
MDLLYTAHVPAGPGPFPTILALHGYGASAHDLLGIAPQIRGGELVLLCPQGPLALEVGPGQRGYAWFPIDTSGQVSPTALVAARGALEGFLEDAMKIHPIDPERIVVLGFSQGGVMAYDLALGRPDRFRALVALSSWLPDAVVAGLAPDPARAALPTLLVHGTRDPMVAIDAARQSKARLESLGIQVAWGEYEMAHEIKPQALRDLVGWLGQSGVLG